MNDQQISQINVQINNFENIDLKSLIVSKYPSQDLRNVKIAQFTVSDYLSISKRVIRQLKAEIEIGNGYFLPFQYNFQNEFGNGNLNSDLSQFVANISAGNFPQSIQFLNRLVYYQIYNGFWDKSKVKVHSLRGIQVSKLEEKLNIISESLSKNLSIFDELKESAKLEIENLNRLKQQKEKELSQISESLSIANKETIQISELLNKSISSNEQINSLLKKSNEELNAVKQISKEVQKDINERKNNFDHLISSLKEKIDNIESIKVKFQEYIQEIDGKKEFFDERNQYLTDLIGREVGASLFETFKQRKKELNPSVTFWKIAVPVMSILTIIGVYAIFSDFFGLLPIDGEDIKNSWEFFALRTLKSVPLFVLLYFTIYQYGKERHYQEEYAFKSAVALTIKAYVDLIKDQEKKDIMILDSVNGIYQSPIKTKDKSKDFPPKEITETFKTMVDTLAEVAKKIKG